MVAVTLGFVVGFLALPGHCLLSDPVFRAPVDTVADCADWIVAQPADNCHLLAERGHVSVGELLSHNPALRRNCDAVEGLSYCKERKSTAGHELAARQSETITGSAPQAIQDLVNSLFIKQTGDKLLTTLWDARVIPVFNSLSYADFSDWLNRSPQGQEMRRNLAAASLIACGLPTLANLVRQWIGVGPDPLICICYDQDTCCGPSDSSCPSGTSKLLARSPKFSSRFEHDDEVASLERRADSYPWAATDPQGQTWSGSFTSVDWPTPRDFAATDWQWQHAMAMDFNDDCTAFYVVEYNQAGIQAGVAGRNVAGETIYNFLNRTALLTSPNTAEHYIEKNLFAKFVKAAIEGNLAGGGTFTTIPGGFFQNFMNTNQAALANIATMPGAQAVTLPARRLMWTLGSGVWRDNFLLLQANLNLMKAAILRGNDPVAPDRMAGAMVSAPRVFVTHLRAALNVLNYMNNADAISFGENSIKAIRWELYNYQRIFNQQNGLNIDVVAAWDTWYQDYMAERFQTLKNWLIANALDGHEHWRGGTDGVSQTMEAICSLYVGRARALAGLSFQTYPTGTPQSYNS